MMVLCQKINLQEQQRNRNATANFVNLIGTSTVPIAKKSLISNELSALLIYKRCFSG